MAYDGKTHEREPRSHRGPPRHATRRLADSNPPWRQLHDRLGNRGAGAALGKRSWDDGVAQAAEPKVGSPTLLTRSLVGSPTDRHEAKAESIANQIAASRSEAGQGAGGSVPRAKSGAGMALRSDAKTSPLREVSLARLAGAPTEVQEAIASPSGPIEPTTRVFLESKLGSNLGDVRVHTGSTASRSARALQADAYTIGRHIVFDQGRYAPGTGPGDRLLAHEVVHVLQQSASNVGLGSDLPLIQRQQATGTTATAPPEGSVNQVVSASAGAPATVTSLEFHATVGAGQVLTRDATKVVHTDEATRVDVRVTSYALTVTFTPALVITSTAWHRANIWLNEVAMDFTTAQFRFNSEARGITRLAAYMSGPSVDDQLRSGLGALLSGLPSAMRTAGYDPFADPNLGANIAAFTASLSSGGSAGPGASPPTATAVSTNAEIVLGGEIRRTSGRFSVVIPAGTRVSVDATLGEGIPGSMRDVRVTSLRVSFYHPTSQAANVELRIAGVDLPVVAVQGVTMSAGGHLQFSYRVITEDVEAIFRLIAVVDAVRSGRGGEVRGDALDSHQPAVHAVIDAEIANSLEPMLRELILSNRRAVPGLDLGELFGFGPEMGDFIAVPPAGPGTASG